MGDTAFALGAEGLLGGAQGAANLFQSLLEGGTNNLNMLRSLIGGSEMIRGGFEQEQRLNEQVLPKLDEAYAGVQAGGNKQEADYNAALGEIHGAADAARGNYGPDIVQGASDMIFGPGGAKQHESEMIAKADEVAAQATANKQAVQSLVGQRLNELQKATQDQVGAYKAGWSDFTGSEASALALKGKRGAAEIDAKLSQGLITPEQAQMAKQQLEWSTAKAVADTSTEGYRVTSNTLNDIRTHGLDLSSQMMQTGVAAYVQGSTLEAQTGQLAAGARESAAKMDLAFADFLTGTKLSVAGALSGITMAEGQGAANFLKARGDAAANTALNLSAIKQQQANTIGNILNIGLQYWDKGVTLGTTGMPVSVPIDVAEGVAPMVAAGQSFMSYWTQKQAADAQRSSSSSGWGSIMAPIITAGGAFAGGAFGGPAGAAAGGAAGGATTGGNSAPGTGPSDWGIS